MYREYLRNYRHLVAIKNIFLAACVLFIYYIIDPDRNYGLFMAGIALFAATFELVAITASVATRRAIEEEIRSQD